MDRYGLPNPEKTGVIDWLTIPEEGQVSIAHPEKGGVLVNVGDPDLHRLLVESGLYLWVDPVTGDREKPGPLEFGDGTVTHSVIPWTQEEIDAEDARAAEDAEISQAILDGNLSSLTYAQLETAVAGESPVIQKIAKGTWALLKDYSRRNNI
jgi:hypothetical protein